MKDSRNILGNINLPGGTSQISALLMSIAGVAIPVILKVQKVLAEKKAEKMIEDSHQDSKVITIKAEHVESVKDGDLPIHR